MEEGVSRATIRSVRIYSSSIAERISSEIFPSLNLRSAIGFRGVVTNVGASDGLITTAKLEAKVLKD